MHERQEWEVNIAGDTLDFTQIDASMLPDSLQDLGWQTQIQTAFRTDFLRHIWLFERPGCVIELVCDTGLVSSSYGRDPLSEIELELKQGQVNDLYELATLIAQTIPMQVSTVSKAQRGMRLRYPGIELPDPVAASDWQQIRYDYEAWLVYWEAICHQQDNQYCTSLQHVVRQLSQVLPSPFAEQLSRLEAHLAPLFEATEPSDVVESLLHLSQQTPQGLAMLAVGHYLQTLSSSEA